MLRRELRREVHPETGALLDRRSFARLLQALCQDQAIALIREDRNATVFATDTMSQLPQKMSLVANGVPCVWLISAGAMDEVVPDGLI